MNKQKQLFKYIFLDIVSAIVSWALFILFRAIAFDKISPEDIGDYALHYNFAIIFLFIPLYWFAVHYISGYYNQVLRKSRLSELFTTIISSFFGCLVLFFFLLMKDRETYDYYISFFVLLILHFLFTYAGRVIITQAATKNTHNRIWGFNTLIIGTGKNALSIAYELDQMKQSLGNNIIGFVATESNHTKVDQERILGTLNDLEKIIEERKIKEIIVAVDKSESNLIFNILGRSYQHDVEVKTIPSLHEIIHGGIRMSTIYAMPLISLSQNDMPYWQQNIKRIFDIFTSIFVLIFMSPLFLLIALKVKLSSPGPVFYKQERIGKHGKPFKMIKFRTMKVDSEVEIPLLATVNDERVTSFGKILRKYRLDELPQFYNVLKGNMSIVGYRPERQYFIDRIVKKAPHYYLLQRISPGITSWGMVKYGYANSVDKMVERLEYDIIYIENLSLMIDLKILIYTFKIIFNGRGI